MWWLCELAVFQQHFRRMFFQQGTVQSRNVTTCEGESNYVLHSARTSTLVEYVILSTTEVFLDNDHQKRKLHYITLQYITI